MTPDPQSHTEQTLSSLTPTALPDYLHARLTSSLDTRLTLPEKLLLVSYAMGAVAAILVLALTLSQLLRQPSRTQVPPSELAIRHTLETQFDRPLAAK